MAGEFVPSEVITADGTITLSEGRETTEVMVENTDDRPIQVGSHFHFFKANAALSFGHEATYGIRLSTPAGTTVRFEPDDQTSAELVTIGGKHRAHRMSGVVNGSVGTDPSAAVEHLYVAGFANTSAPNDEHGTTEESSE